MMANFSIPLLVDSNARTPRLRLGLVDANARTTRTRRSITTNFPAKDVPIFDASKNISGTIYTIGGAAAAGATVKLFRQVDDLLCKVGVTDVGGHYVFSRDSDDVFAYYVLAYTNATSPQVHGVSDRGAIPA